MNTTKIDLLTESSFNAQMEALIAAIEQIHGGASGTGNVSVLETNTINVSIGDSDAVFPASDYLKSTSETTVTFDIYTNKPNTLCISYELDETTGVLTAHFNEVVDSALSVTLEIRQVE